MVLLVILFLFYRQQKKVHLNTERAFWRSFCVTTICITLDILSVAALNYADMLPDGLVEFVCKTYLVSLEAVAFCSLLYVCVDIFDRSGLYKKVVNICIISIIIGTLLIYLLPIDSFVSEDGSQIYTYGPSANATYAVVLMLILINIFFTIKEKKKLNPIRRKALLGWMSIWILAAFIQFIDKQLLIVGYACALGIMILYIRLENPETNQDRKTGLFNQSALKEYLRQLYDREQSYAVLSLFFDYSLDKSILGETEDEISIDVIGYLMEQEDALAFKFSEDEIVLVYDGAQHAKSSVERLHKRFENGWGQDDAIVLHPFSIFLEDIHLVNAAKDVLPLMQYIREGNRDNSMESVENDLIYVDQHMIEQMYYPKQFQLMSELYILE